MPKTLMIEARTGSIPEEIEELAKVEGVDPNKLRTRVAEGRVVIARNIARLGKVKLIGIEIGRAHV